MNPHIDDILQIAKRIKEKAARTAKPKLDDDGRGQHDAAELCRAIKTKCLTLVEQNKIHAAQWDAWFTVRDVECPEHPGTELKLDRTESLHRSWQNKSNCVVFHPCPACQAAIKAARANAWLTLAGVPDNMLHATFDNWTPRNAEDRKTLAEAQRYAANPRGAFMLIGKAFGVGKSHLAIAIMRTIRRGRFLTHAAFVKALRKRYSDQHAEDIVERSIAPSFLVLDDLGISSGGRDELPALHQVLDERYGDNKPFILTANVDKLADLAPVLGDRMLDRLMDIGSTRVLSGKSWRGQNKQNNNLHSHTT